MENLLCFNIRIP